MAGVPNVQPDEFDYFHFKTIDNGMVAYALLRKQLSRLYMIWARHQIAMLLSFNQLRDNGMRYIATLSLTIYSYRH